MNSTIRARVDSFVADLSQLIREAALDAVQQALGTGSVPAAGRSMAGRKAASAKRGAPKPAGRKRGRPPGKAVSTQSADRLLAEIRRQPGQRLEELGRALKTPTANLRPALLHLLAQGQVRAEGKARGTNYHVGSGSPPRKKSAAKKAKKKAGRKSKKKTGKKKATKRPATSGAAA